MPAGEGWERAGDVRFLLIVGDAWDDPMNMRLEDVPVAARLSEGSISKGERCAYCGQTTGLKVDGEDSVPMVGLALEVVWPGTHAEKQGEDIRLFTAGGLAEILV